MYHEVRIISPPSKANEWQPREKEKRETRETSGWPTELRHSLPAMSRTSPCIGNMPSIASDPNHEEKDPDLHAVFASGARANSNSPKHEVHPRLAQYATHVLMNTSHTHICS